ncbi:hypothetical protein PTKIN_Ptkin06aG0118700 [Pterospermum kingtungense]
MVEPQESTAIGWNRRPSSCLKCNIDAALFRTDNMVGWGMVLRDEFGQFVASRTSISTGFMNAKEVEAMGLLEPLS